MSGRLEGKTALVTGGASGLGRAMAVAMAAEGARVAVADLADEREAIAAELGEAGFAIEADVSSEADAKRMVAETVERFGRLDVLCNNAGIDGDLIATAEMSVENFDRVVAINLRGVFLGHLYGIPAMLTGGGGSIVNTSSIAGLSGVPGGAAYCAAKAGVLGLTRVAAVEYAQAGVRANAICPGVIETPMVASVGIDDPALAGAIAATPAGRLGRPEEIAATAVFLASDESAYLTGATLPVDGGYTAV